MLIDSVYYYLLYYLSIAKISKKSNNTQILLIFLTFFYKKSAFRGVLMAFFKINNYFCLQIVGQPAFFH